MYLNTPQFTPQHTIPTTSPHRRDPNHLRPMAETPIRFGMIGCAEIAQKLCRAIHLAPNAALVAIGSRTLSKAQAFAADNRLPSSVHIHGNYDAVLEDPAVDVVYIPLPTSLHVRWAVAAAEKKKHVLMEKPVATCVEDFDRIVAACDANGVQFMDGTMWMHHPRTEVMQGILKDSSRIGELKRVHCTFSFSSDAEFLKNDIRVKPDLDSLGALGDVGWYCIRSILWAVDYEMPKTVTAHPGTVTNEAGVILSCGSTLQWEDGKLATFQCSFLSHMTMELYASGTKGTLSLSDFVIPFEESSASFTYGTDLGFTHLVTGWEPLPSKHVINTELPQEALMVTEFSRLVASIRDAGANSDKKWPTISRKTQMVLNAVKTSVEKGCEPVVIY